MTGNRPGIILQARDRQFLAELGKFRWADREQAKQIAGFRSTTRVNTRLLKLVRAGFLCRFFTGSIAAGRKAIYTLSPKGAAIVGLESGPKWHKHTDTTASDLFLDHQLELNSVVLAAQKPNGAANSLCITTWQYFSQPLAPNSKLVPDAYLEASTASGIRALFLEVDLGTETHGVWRKKVESYLQFARSGEFERRFRQPRFRVLILARSHVRIQNIRRTVCRMTDKIFWFSTFEQIHSEGFWAQVWLRPAGDRMHSLL